MKRIFSLSLLLLVLASACKKQVAPEPAGEETSKPVLHPNSAGDGQNDLLGYGYDITGEYANSSASKFAVIDVAKLKAAQPTRVEWDLSSRQEGYIISGENAQSYLKRVSARVSADFSYGLFKGNISGSYTGSESFSSKYLYSSYNLVIQQKRVKLNATLDLLKQYLHASFVQDVQTLSPQALVAAYGTHVLSDIILGAKLQVLYRSESFESGEFRARAGKAGVGFGLKKIFNISTGYEDSTSNTAKSFSQSLHFKTYGGDPSQSLVGQLPVGNNSPTVNIQPWQNSATLANSELIEIPQGGIIYLWELIADAAKKQAVKSYIEQYLKDNQVVVTPVPVHVFYSSRDGNHTYTVNRNDWPYESNGYTYLGVNFGAFASQVDGTVPVHVWFSPVIGNHTYTINKYDYPYERDGYVYLGVNFYAYPSQVPGASPIHVWYSPVIGNHTYTINKNDYPYERDGYRYLGVNFYGVRL
ncbi:hypothetical protein HHL16_23950 [Pseudoflavitalea sp. G-6-1-2]|uniref:MAC/perforin domain-containing protein n=1 Tax=Pseudoflavitalea sp. G-6-1-2 TaxID=2728841 RepID=UPI00146A2A1F|nr:MAC/perforin domain-containing protein [Pseudoflavitalea sp. G-6-1-2]NML23956.1 hypothetical protein [Pseudoflavitalea sp. G-6-1-2]